MKLQILVVAIVSMAIALTARAEEFGLRFVVSAALGKSAQQKKQTTEKLAAFVEELNQYYRNSDVRLNARLMNVEFAAMESRDVMDILVDMENERGAFPEMFAKANEYGADFTIAIVDNLMHRGSRGCGRAFAVNKTIAEIASTRRAFAAINFVCGAHTLAHELGHLMGLNHGFLVDTCEPRRGHTTAIARYANGYAEGNCDGKPQSGEFGTIMVGGWMREINGNSRGNLPMFSNPRIRDPRCGARGICGDEETGDEARALNENARYFVSHEEPDVHTLPYASAALAKCIRERYHRVEIRDLVELACSSFGIDSLSGIEQLTALRRIDLTGNRITDATPLFKLEIGQIERITLSSNPLRQCASVKQHFDNKVLLPNSCGTR